MMLSVSRRAALVGLLAAFLVAASPARAADWLVAFQAVPDEPDGVYAKQAARTASLATEFGPAILSAIGLDPGSFDAEVVIGGYRGHTAPSVVLHLDPGADVDRIAAAFGLVFAQSSVLVWRDARSGGSLAVAVAFPSLTPTLADYFFRTAAGVDPALAAGFTAQDSRLLFINLRGSTRNPSDSLDDDHFTAGLRRAAAAFGGLATVTTGRVDAHLVSGGEPEFRGRLNAGALPQLEKLKARRAELVAGH